MKWSLLHARAKSFVSIHSPEMRSGITLSRVSAPGWLPSQRIPISRAPMLQCCLRNAAGTMLQPQHQHQQCSPFGRLFSTMWLAAAGVRKRHCKACLTTDKHALHYSYEQSDISREGQARSPLFLSRRHEIKRLGLSGCGSRLDGSLVVAISSGLGCLTAIVHRIDAASAKSALCEEHRPLDWRNGRIATSDSTGSLPVFNHGDGICNHRAQLARRRRHHAFGETPARPWLGRDLRCSHHVLYPREHDSRPPLSMRNQVRALRTAKDW